MAELSYSVTHGFTAKVNGEDRWFSRDNAHEVKELPRSLRDELLAAGAIKEFNAKGEVIERSAPAPAVPANTGKEK
jgi:hypothetical protein